jgi:hypothetical protein
VIRVLSSSRMAANASAKPEIMHFPPFCSGVLPAVL